MDETKSQKITQFNIDSAAKKTASLTPQQQDIQKSGKSNAEIVAERAAENKQVREQKQQEKQQQEQEDIQKSNIRSGLQMGADAASSLKENVDNKVNPLKDFISKQPTPGGIGALLAILLFFLFALIPVDTEGHTRLQLMWLTITGKTHMSYKGADVPALGASGDFGSTTGGTTPSTNPITTPPSTQLPNNSTQPSNNPFSGQAPSTQLPGTTTSINQAIIAKNGNVPIPINLSDLMPDVFGE